MNRYRYRAGSLFYWSISIDCTSKHWLGYSAVPYVYCIPVLECHVATRCYSLKLPSNASVKQALSNENNCWYSAALYCTCTCTCTVGTLASGLRSKSFVPRARQQGVAKSHSSCHFHPPSYFLGIVHSLYSSVTRYTYMQRTLVKSLCGTVVYDIMQQLNNICYKH